MHVTELFKFAYSFAHSEYKRMCVVITKFQSQYLIFFFFGLLEQSFRVTFFSKYTGQDHVKKRTASKE